MDLDKFTMSILRKAWKKRGKKDIFVDLAVGEMASKVLGMWLEKQVDRCYEEE